MYIAFEIAYHLQKLDHEIAYIVIRMISCSVHISTYIDSSITWRSYHAHLFPPIHTLL